MIEFTPERLERYMQIAQDAKKELMFFEGEWFWCDRENRDDPVTFIDAHGFPTFWECLCDVVDPYVEEGSWEE